MTHTKFIPALFFTFLMLATGGCKPKKNAEQKAEDKEPPVEITDTHNSRNSLDWNGTYQGILPCADCEGIQTRLTLMNNGDFRRTLIYLGSEEASKSESGTFEWDEGGFQITLHPRDGEPQKYQVGENRLFHLDRDGNRITGDLAEKYELVKNRADRALENKKWILTELMGKEIKVGEGNKEAFLYFDSELGRITGNNSCNLINGNYDLKEGNRITFGRIASTMMACPDMETGDRFNQVLEQVDNYAISDGMLSLNRARMAPLAKFRQE